MNAIVAPADNASIAASISPLRVIVHEAYVLLVRSVTIGDTALQQGCVLRLDDAITSLQQAIAHRATAAGAEIHLFWQEQTPSARKSMYLRRTGTISSYQLSAPFDHLYAEVTLPDSGPSTLASWLRGGIVFGAVLLIITFIGVERGISSALAFSRRRHDFVAAVTHELKTPLTAIRMQADMLQQGMIADPAQQHTYHQSIQHEAERLSRLVGNVLDLARIEQGTYRAQTQVGNPRAVLDEAINLVQPMADQHGLLFVVNVADHLPAVRFDRDGLVQVLVNILDNAIKFSGPMNHKPEIHIDVQPDTSGIVLSVRDFGPGIPTAQLSKVFESFYRGERELTRTTKGTGIGLALVHGLLKAMHATIQASNHPDGGCQMTVRLAAV